jgi:nucleoside-diphosphate-sugar epimerase
MIGPERIIKEMRIFITGGTGFIGKWLVNELSVRGHELLVLKREAADCQNSNGIYYISGNLNGLEKVAKYAADFKPQILTHLAWEGLPDYSFEASKKNIDYGLGVYRFAKDLGCHTIVSTGSCWEYAARFGMLSENDNRLCTYSLFPAAKNALRFCGEAFAQEHGLNFYWLRLFFVYGPGQRSTSLIPYIVDSIKRGRKINLSNPNNRNDFIYVKDAITAICEVIETQPKHHLYNIGSGEVTAVGEVVKTVYAELGCDYEDSVDWEKPVKAEQDFYADISRIARETNWKPIYDLRKGIKETIISFG